MLIKESDSPTIKPKYEGGLIVGWITANKIGDKGWWVDNTRRGCNESRAVLKDAARRHFLDYGQRKDLSPLAC